MIGPVVGQKRANQRDPLKGGSKAPLTPLQGFPKPKKREFCQRLWVCQVFFLHFLFPFSQIITQSFTERKLGWFDFKKIKKRWWLPVPDTGKIFRSSMKEKRTLDLFFAGTRLLQMYGIYPFEWLIGSVRASQKKRR